MKECLFEECCLEHWSSSGSLRWPNRFSFTLSSIPHKQLVVPVQQCTNTTEHRHSSSLWCVHSKTCLYLKLDVMLSTVCTTQAQRSHMCLHIQGVDAVPGYTLFQSPVFQLLFRLGLFLFFFLARHTLWLLCYCSTLLSLLNAHQPLTQCLSTCDSDCGLNYLHSPACAG